MVELFSNGLWEGFSHTLLGRVERCVVQVDELERDPVGAAPILLSHLDTIGRLPNEAAGRVAVEIVACESCARLLVVICHLQGRWAMAAALLRLLHPWRTLVLESVDEAEGRHARDTGVDFVRGAHHDEFVAVVISTREHVCQSPLALDREDDCILQLGGHMLQACQQRPRGHGTLSPAHITWMGPRGSIDQKLLDAELAPFDDDDLARRHRAGRVGHAREIERAGQLELARCDLLQLRLLNGRDLAPQIWLLTRMEAGEQHVGRDRGLA